MNTCARSNVSSEKIHWTQTLPLLQYYRTATETVLLQYYRTATVLLVVPEIRVK